MAKKRAGRKGGKPNRGFYYRSGRGWYALEDGRSTPLTDPSGERLVREAHARWLTDCDKAKQDAKRADQAKARAAAAMTVLQVCQSYLANAKATGAAKTHEDRADTLFDFCFGLPPEFRSKNDKKAEELTAARKKAMAAKRIHEGYGKLPVIELLPLHVDQWLNAHPTWKGGRRSRVQAVKRALNYATEAGLIEANPIRGYRTPKSTSRVTYLTPDQETALRAEANAKLSLAIQVCIRTGARQVRVAPVADSQGGSGRPFIADCIGRTLRRPSGQPFEAKSSFRAPLITPQRLGFPLFEQFGGIVRGAGGGRGFRADQILLASIGSQ